MLQVNQARGGQGNEVENLLKNTLNDLGAGESHEAEGQTEEEDTEIAP